MATINKRGPFQFQAQIRRKGFPIQTRTFYTRREAEAWASVIESEMIRGIFTDRTELEQTTLGEALDRYQAEVTPMKREPLREMQRIGAWKKHPLAQRSLASLRSVDFAQYRDARLKIVGANAVRLELAVMSHLFTIASQEWSLPISNPIKNIRKPKLPSGRDRRLLEGEESALLAAAAESKAAPWLGACIKLAIETGMRANEILTLEWRQVFLMRNIIKLENTKNGDSRSVALSKEAVSVLETLPRSFTGRVIPRFGSTTSLGHAFTSACKKTGIEGLHFHDLRHEAASRYAPFMTVQTLAKIMGWKTIQMAMRYYNPTDDELVAAVRKSRNGGY